MAFSRHLGTNNRATAGVVSHRRQQPMNSETAASEQTQRFSPGDPAAREHLLDQGYAVFKPVVAPKQCSISVGHFWDWIRVVSDQKVMPGDVDTYHHWPLSHRPQPHIDPTYSLPPIRTRTGRLE